MGDSGQLDKKRRLFVRSPGTDDMWLICGGPDSKEALVGLTNIIQAEVEDLLHGLAFDNEPTIELKMMEMSDEEIENLEEI